LATTGHNRGEVLGLWWLNIDSRVGTLEQRQALTARGKDWEPSEPKTAAGRRGIDLDSHTVAMLTAWKGVQLTERWTWQQQATYHDHGLVFCWEDGHPYHPQHVSEMFRRRAKKAGLPAFCLHEVRHSWATAALRAGENVKVVSQRLGHASIAITLDTYAAVLPGDQRENATRVAGLFVPEESVTDR
jgi:integrase